MASKTQEETEISGAEMRKRLVTQHLEVLKHYLEDGTGFVLKVRTDKGKIYFSITDRPLISME